ncbi:MAG: hypothetical protein V3U96_07965 [Paracoccaceae bacterium]
MSSEAFQERLSRLNGAGPAQTVEPQTEEPRLAEHSVTPGPGLLAHILAGFILIPLGAMASVLRPMYMQATNDWVYFYHLLAFVALTHLVLFLGGLAAMIGFKRWPFFAKTMLMMWAGYGVGTAMTALIVT